MDELRGPNIQIVLHLKEGLGFGFLKTSFLVSGSLNGYMLETDPIVPSHAPVFDAELVWEADKRRFRSLRVQNVPVKVEVFTMATQGRKDKVGYLLLSLLGAQPCPSNKVVDVKHSWHKLLGVRSEGKCCHPQLLISLSIEDRINTPTPRNELRLFHSNEIAYPRNTGIDPPTGRSVLMTLSEYRSESKKTVSSPDLHPKLLCDEGLIQVGTGRQLFILSLVIGSVENIDLLLPMSGTIKDAADCFVTYSVFTHSIMTDRVGMSRSPNGVGARVQFNQRSSLRLATDLSALGRYFSECPCLVTRICANDKDIGICSLDLRKLIPTDDTKQFVERFCNSENALKIYERCYILRCEELGDQGKPDGRRPYVDIEMSLKYVGIKENKQKSNILSARSASQLDSGRDTVQIQTERLGCKSGSCTNFDQDVGGLAYTNMDANNTARYKNAYGDSVLQTNEITELIRGMCDSFAQSQEKLLATHVRPRTCDAQVQCEATPPAASRPPVPTTEQQSPDQNVNMKLETSKSDTCIHNNNNEKDLIKLMLSAGDRNVIMQKFVDELEDWKEKQQELFKCQLKRKEDYHLELLSKEWTKKRLELECRLSKGIEQCRNLAGDLSRATDDFRLRGYRNTERERKLLDAKKALESHYTAKYQELREASQKMEDDMHHQIKLKDMRIEELELRVMQLEKEIDVHKNNLRKCEKEAEGKYSGLTKDQTASLIQELRCLEEKLESAVQSKAFFKEQWGRALRELHLLKLSTRRQMLTQLKQDRRQLGDMGLDTIEDEEKTDTNQYMADVNKSKDDFYVDLLANTPALETQSIINNTERDVFDIYSDSKRAPKNPMNDKLNLLISQRDSLIQCENPDEELVQQLNQEIRSMLLNCGS